MTSRRGFLLGFVVVAVLLVVVIGWQVYQMRDPCMTGSDGGSCPALADVGEVRYGISVGQDLVDIEQALTQYGSITRTNASTMFASQSVYAVEGIEPTDFLVARAADEYDGNEGPYLLLFRFRGSFDGVWPVLCDYLTESRRAAQPECGSD